MIRERSFLVFLLLTVVTCGIYPIIFYCLMNEDMNIICNGDGKDNPNCIIVILLMFITCGIYGIIWMYNQANRLQDEGNRYGLNIREDGTTILLWYLLGILLCGVGPIIAIYILIKNFNLVARAYNSNLPTQRLQ